MSAEPLHTRFTALGFRLGEGAIDGLIQECTKNRASAHQVLEQLASAE